MEKIAKTTFYLLTNDEIKNLLRINSGQLINVIQDHGGFVFSFQDTNPKYANTTEEMDIEEDEAEPPSQLPEPNWDRQKQQMSAKIKTEAASFEEHKNDLLKELRDNRQVPMHAEELKEVAAQKKFVNPKTETPDEEEDDDW